MQSKRRTQQFVAAFIISGIVIAALCGFVLVDLSTERYMAGESAPLFQISGLDADGVCIGLLGKSYLLETQALTGAQEVLWQRRGWLPSGVRITGGLVAQGYLALREYLEQAAQPEEPW